MQNVERSRLLAAALASFLAIVTVDFLAHAVFLSPWWRATATYWRPPLELFKLIPYAYAALALYAAAFTWLLVVLKGPGPSVGIATTFGAMAGAFVGLTTVLAIYSVVPLPRTALLVFPASAILEFAAAGASASLVLAAARPWRRMAMLACAFLVLVVAGVVVQNLFFPAPAASSVSSVSLWLDFPA